MNVDLAQPYKKIVACDMGILLQNLHNTDLKEISETIHFTGAE